MTLRSTARLVPICLLVICLLPATAMAGTDEWKPVDPADLVLKEPVVEKDADAEGIFWDVRVDNGEAGEVVLTHYVRVKVFNERGKDAQSKIDLTYFDSDQIKDIAARTIKPDGTIIELRKEDVFERVLVRVSGIKIRSRSFALPGVVPGAIIEYRWREVRNHTNADHLELQFQRDIPIRSITYSVRPHRGMYSTSMHYHTFQMPSNLKFAEAEKGFSNFTVSNVTAFHEEPLMPPELSVRSWILLYYADTSVSPERFWIHLGQAIHEISKTAMSVDDSVRRAATEVVGDAKEPLEKLRRIYEYCKEIRNLSYQSAGITAAEREKFKPNESPADTLRNRIGTGRDIDNLFGALAAAAGFEAHLAFSGNRQLIFFDRTFVDPYFLLLRGVSFVAVRLGETWRFFDPAGRYTPFGMLGWRAEGQSALVVGTEPVWVRTPISAPEKSLQKRTGKFRLLEDGTLEGDVQVEYSGQFASDRKRANDDESPEAREKILRDEIKRRLSTAELSNVRIENVLDPIKPFTYFYHVRVPNYAQRTAKRLFLQPNFFTQGLSVIFTASVRKNDIDFRYAWSESDHLTIELPAGFAPDNAEVPPPITPQMTQNICSQQINIGVTTEGRTLVYDRKFFFGGQGDILFPVSRYGPLKQLFETLNQANQHSISLKLTAPSATN